MTYALEKLHKMVKDSYNELTDEEKNNIQNGKANNNWWITFSNLIRQVLANGGTVTIQN